MKMKQIFQKLAWWIFANSYRQLVCVGVSGQLLLLGKVVKTTPWKIFPVMVRSGQRENERGGAFCRECGLQPLLPGISVGRGGSNGSGIWIHALHDASCTVILCPHQPLNGIHHQGSIGLRVL